MAGKTNICRVCNKPCDFRSDLCQPCSNSLRSTPVKDRLLSKIRRTTDGCWEFTGLVINSGYGRISCRMPDGTFKYKTAHRKSWEEFKGPIPRGLCVLHRCDNKICINPDHLFLGTHKDNVQDMHRKGKWRPPSPIRPHTWGERNPQAVLSNTQVSEIRRLRGEGHSGVSIAEKFGTNRVYIYAICSGRKRKHG